MLPLDKVRDLISKHNSLEKDLSSGSIDKKKYAEKSKEYSDLNEIVNEANEYLLFDKEKTNTFTHCPFKTNPTTRSWELLSLLSVQV